MADEFDKILDSMSASEALKFVCLFLAQNDTPEPPHEELGYSSQNKAFAAVAEKFNSTAGTVKNERDAFDYHTDSARVGWKNR